ncbi:hypothetical protein [Treponema socranskii]|uniref:hypothetical protein n=1 Tax=Treponema socranskii TaxID=53419 RepID=UPI003D8E428B
MAADNVYFYLVEGQTEEKAVKVLKEKYVVSGKVIILHQRKITATRLRLIPRNSKSIIVFDTDSPNTKQTLDTNINLLKTGRHRGDLNSTSA